MIRRSRYYYKMQDLRLPSAQDVVRLIRPTLGETVEATKAYYEQQPAWSYGPARAVAKPVFSGEISLETAVEGCKTRGNPLGRKSNAEVAAHVWHAAQGRSFLCYELSRRPFAIRKDLSFWVDPLFFFVEGGRVRIFWLQPRRHYAPTIEGLGTLAVIVRMTFSDEFDDFELELLDLSVPDGTEERVPRTFGFGNLPVLSEEQVQIALERFAQAYDTVRKTGVRRPTRRGRPDDKLRSTLFNRS